MIGTPKRCVQGAPITVVYQSVDADGEPTTTDPGVVTVDVTRADGTALVTADATTGTAGTRAYTIAATQTAELDELSVTWKDATTTIGCTTVNVVGCPYFKITGTAEEAGIRDVEPTMRDEVEADPATVIRARGEVEAMFERACGHVLSFVPRFAVATLIHPGTPSLRLPHYYVRAVRWVKYGSSLGALVDFNDYDLDTTVFAEPSGMATITGGSWPPGRLVVGYEHGLDAPPDDVRRVAMWAVRRQVQLTRNAVSARAMSYTTSNGEIQRFPTPGLGPWTTGVPEIDEVLESYRRRYPSLLVG